jgi:hypothetical protein
MADEESTIFRKIYFFKVEHFEDLGESLPAAVERIANLPFNDTGRYKLDNLSRNRLCAFPDSSEYPLRIRFGKTRRDALPEIEHQGNLKTLELQEDAGLIDICHVVIFADGFVAAEWNHEGPKLAQLGPYLFEKGRLNSAPKFLPLLERDIVQVVRALDSVRVLEVDVPPDAAELAREADENFYTAIKATEALGATKRVGLRLTAERSGDRLKGIAGRLAEIVKERPHERERFKGLNVSGYAAGSSTQKFVDILESKLVAGESFIRTSERSRSIDSDDAYRVIERAYIENKPKIESSAISTEW